MEKRRIRFLGCDVEYLMGWNPRKRGTKTCTKEDLMQLIWLQAGQEDLDHMNAVFLVSKLKKFCTKAPPTLGKRKRLELVENFKWLLRPDETTIPFVAITEAGLVDEDLLKSLCRKHNISNWDKITCEEFVHMLCPNGFRPKKDSTIIIDKDGTGLSRITFNVQDDSFDGWLHNVVLRRLSPGERVLIVKQYDWNNLPPILKELEKSEDRSGSSSSSSSSSNNSFTHRISCTSYVRQPEIDAIIDGEEEDELEMLFNIDEGEDETIQENDDNVLN